MSNIDDPDVEYLDKYFPKGNKLRGHAMVLLAMARGVGMQQLVDETHQQERANRRKIQDNNQKVYKE